MAFYRTGTISLTNGSNAVIGAGTDFLLGASIGECVQAPDGKLYEILKINCAQGTTVVLGVTLPSIELGQPYLGATASGQAYSIVPTQSYIRDLAGQAATLVNGYGDTKTNAILLTAADKATPVDTDKLAMRDSVSGLARMLTWANAKAALASWLNGGTLPISATTISASENSSASTFTGTTIALTSYMDAAQANGVVIRGNTGSPANQTEIWGTGANKATFSPTGLAVTGGISATGALTTAGIKEAGRNVGLIVTPAAWASAAAVAQFPNAGSIGSEVNGYLTSMVNAYESSPAAWNRLQSAGASRYQIGYGYHRWYTAPSDIAGAAIAWNQVMTLDSNGNLLTPSMYTVTTASAANAFVTSGGQIQRSTSSIKYKADVETLNHSAADAIFAMRPVWYRSLCEADNAGWSWYGLIAEEVALLDPRLVHWSYPNKTIEDQPAAEAIPAVLDDDGVEVTPAITAREATTKQVPDKESAPIAEGVQYERLTVLLIDVVQRQKQKIDAMESRLAALEAA